MTTKTKDSGVSHRKAVSVALSEQEKQAVKNAAIKQGVTLSTFLRMAALNYVAKQSK